MKLAIWSLLALIMVACGGKDSPASNFAGDAPKDEHSSAEQDAGAEGDTLELVYGIPTALYSMQEGEIASGQTFSTLLEKLGVDNSTCNNLLAAVGDKFDVRKMQAGRGYHAYFDGADSLAYLLYEASQMKVVVFRLQDTLGAEVYEKIMDTRLRYSEVEISNSLWLDTQNAGCSYLLALRLSDIYAWTIDFFGLQKGDSFKALYEESSVGGKVVNIGKVYNVVFRHNGKEYNCFYFEEGDEGGNVYWNEKGESFRKAFL
ncbi:MAG: hypothetical protein HUJ93_07720, partial [Bacteroidales bacterium]|nr:hypothetical protein [Bacteroidales bacterium]